MKPTDQKHSLEGMGDDSTVKRLVQKCKDWSSDPQHLHRYQAGMDITDPYVRNLYMDSCS